MLIGGTHTCAGTPALQAKASLLEGRPGPQQGGRTQVRGCWVQSWGWTWMGLARPRSSRAGAAGWGAGSQHLLAASPYGPGVLLPLWPEPKGRGLGDGLRESEPPVGKQTSVQGG